MIFFLVPVFNESLNLKSFCAAIKNCLPGERKYFVFSDDGSTDNSREIILSSFDVNECVILGDGINRGPGYSFNIGFEWILNKSIDVEDRIVTLEADNTSDISILPKMLLISNLNFELVLASVYVQGGGFDKTSFLRKILSSVANLFLRFFFDIKVQTLSSFYRIYHVETVRKIQGKYGEVIRERGFLCMIEILLKAIRQGATMIEVPMILRSNARKGKSKMKKLKTASQYISFILKQLVA